MKSLAYHDKKLGISQERAIMLRIAWDKMFSISNEWTHYVEMILSWSFHDIQYHLMFKTQRYFTASKFMIFFYLNCSQRYFTASVF